MSLAVQFFCPRWGYERLSWRDFAAYAADHGYDGVEVAFPRDTPPAELDAAWDAAARRGLPVIVQHYDTYEADFAEHRDLYAAWFEMVRGYGALKVNSQTGKDFFAFRQNAELFDIADAFARSSGIPVVHETHRNKFSFAAHVTRDYLERLPDLRLTLDISHWCCVAESYLADQPEAVALAIARTDHLHARVGHPEGPQVPDPRAPEWADAVETHFAWWDRVVERHRAEALPVMTVTAEFGPAPYTTPLPHSREPIADQWAINAWVVETLRSRWE